MHKSPAFQFYPKQWLGDDRVMLMDFDARGMHLHCMCIAWQQTDACTLPDDDEKLRRWCGNPDRDDWEKRLKPQIFSAWKKEKGYWIQTGLKREYSKQNERSDKNRKAANARWKNEKKGKKKDVCKRNASAMQMECSSSSTSTSVKNILSGRPDFVANVISFLNEQAGTKFKSSTEANRKNILARVNDGHDFEAFQEVIKKKCREWGNTDMARYLRPATLFAPSKFESYLNEPISINSGTNQPPSHNSGGTGRLVI